MRLNISPEQKTSIRKILWYIGIIIAVILLFGIQECRNQKEKNDLLKSVADYQDSAKHYKMDGVNVDYNQSLVLENKKQLEALIAKSDTLSKMVAKFKSVSSTTIIKEYFHVEHDTIKLGDHQIPCDFDPFKVRRGDPNYNFVGTIAPRYFAIDSIFMPNTQDIVMGYKKPGFFKSSEQRIEIVNSNPLITTTNIANYVIQPDKKFYERTWFKVSTGIVGGIVISQALFPKH